MIDNAKILSEFLYKLKFSDIPEKTIENVRIFMIDYFAAAMAGYRINTNFNGAIEKYVFSQGGAEDCSPFFSDKKIPFSKAAFLDACYAHGADMDDGNRKAMGHVGAHVFASVTAAAAMLDCGEQDVITAVIAGYEVYCRVAAAAQPGLVHRGFHSTGTAGAVACAAAVAKLFGLDAEGIYNAMAISVTMASGLMIIAESGQSIKPLNPAKAAESGILAASLARDGVLGGRYPLDSQKGWFHAMTDSVDAEMITKDLGKVFCIDECYIKPYPSCRHTHCGIQAAMEIKCENGISVDDIEKVNIYIYSNAIKIAGMIKVPRTQDETKFSIHYAIACALCMDRFSLQDLDFKKVPSKVFDLIDKIELIPDESMENRDAGIRGCTAQICTKDGNEYKKTVLIPKGDPQNPYTFEDIKGKLEQCAEGVIDSAKQSVIFEKIRDFGKTNKKYERITVL